MALQNIEQPWEWTKEMLDKFADLLAEYDGSTQSEDRKAMCAYLLEGLSGSFQETDFGPSRLSANESFQLSSNNQQQEAEWLKVIAEEWKTMKIGFSWVERKLHELWDKHVLESVTRLFQMARTTTVEPHFSDSDNDEGKLSESMVSSFVKCQSEELFSAKIDDSDATLELSNFNGNVDKLARSNYLYNGLLQLVN